MPSLTTAESGKNGSISSTPGGGDTGDIGAEVVEWNATLSVEGLDATNMDGGGFYDSVEGIKKCVGSFTAVSSSSVPEEGTVTAMVLANGATTGQRTITGDALITSVDQSTPVQGGVITYTANFEFRGSFALGTGA